MNDKLKTASGKTFDCDFFSVIPRPALAYMRVKTDFMTAASIFTNREETSEITYGDYTIVGYTRHPDISQEDDGMIRIRLEKEG